MASNGRCRVWSGGTRITLSTLALGAITGVCAARPLTDAHWVAPVSGSWTDPAMWSTSPNAPNNGQPGAADLYHAILDAQGTAHTITSSANVTLERLTLDSSSATLSVNAGVFAVLGGAEALAGLVRLNGGTLSGAWNIAGGSLRFSSSSNNRIQNLTLAGTASLSDTFAFVRILGGFTNNGVVSLTGQGATLLFNGSHTSGSGHFRFAGSGSAGGESRLVSDNAGALTLAGGTIISGGYGVLGGQSSASGPDEVINQALISADRLGERLYIRPRTFLNDSTVQAVAGGIVTAQGFSLTNNGLIDAGPLSTLELHSSVSINNGTIRGRSAPISIGTALSSFTNNGLIDVVGGSLSLDGDWANAGEISLANAVLRLGGIFTAQDVGNIQRSGVVTTEVRGVWENTGGLIDIGPHPVTVEQTGVIRNGSIHAMPGQLRINNGVLDGVHLAGEADVTFGLAVRNGLTLDGTLRVVSNGVRFLGDQTVDGGLIEFYDDAGFTVQTSSGSPGGTVVFGPSTTILASRVGFAGSGTLASPAVTNKGTVRAIGQGPTIGFQGGFLNEGVIDATNGSVSFGANFRNTGALIVGGGNVVTFSGMLDADNFGLVDTRMGGSVVLSGNLNLQGKTLVLDAVRGSWTLTGEIIGGNVETRDDAALISGNPFGVLNGVTVRGSIIAPGSDRNFRIRNGLTLDGVATVRGQADLLLEGTQTLSGGTYEFLDANGSTRPGATLLNNATITLSESAVWRGAGMSAEGSGSLRVLGRISCDAPGNRFLFGAPINVQNEGVIEATNGGTVEIRSTSNLVGGTLAGGAWKVGAGSTLLLTGGAVAINDADVRLTGANSTFAAVDALRENRGALTLTQGRVLSVAPGVGGFVNAGLISLDATSRIVVTGSLQQTASGVLAASLGLDPAPALTITGPAFMSGTLALSLTDPGAAEWGRMWTVIDASTLSIGGLQIAYDPLQNPGLRWWSAAGSNALAVGIRAVADTNHDSVVDFVDLNNVLGQYGQVAPGLVGDADENGVVNFVDLNWVVSSFGQSAPATVPAPSAALILGIAAAHRRRRAMACAIALAGATHARPVVDAHWAAPLGARWDEGVRWTTSPSFPMNDFYGGPTYRAFLDAVGASNYTVEIRQGTFIVIDELIVQTPGVNSGLYVDGLLSAEQGHLVSGFLRLGMNGGILGGLWDFHGNRLEGISNPQFSIPTIRAMSVSGDLICYRSIAFADSLSVQGDVLLQSGDIRFLGPQLVDSIAITGVSGTNSVALNPDVVLGSTTVIRNATLTPGGAAPPLRVNHGQILVDQPGPDFGIQVALRNEGLISASSGAKLTIWPNGNQLFVNAALTTVTNATLQFFGRWRNDGAISAVNSTLRLGGSIVTESIGVIGRNGGAIELGALLDNTGRTLRLDAASGSWKFVGGEIRGGTLDLRDGVTLSPAPSTSTPINPQFNLVRNLNVTTGDIRFETPGGLLQIAGGLDMNHRRLDISSGGAVRFVEQDQTLVATEIIGGPAQPQATIEAVGITLTLASDVLVHGGWVSFPAQGGSNPAASGLRNLGVISSDVSGATIGIGAGQGAFVTTNEGEITALNGGKLLVRGQSLKNAGLLAAESVLQAITVNSGVRLLNEGTLRAAHGGQLVFAAGSTLDNLVAGVLSGGRFEMEQGSIVFPGPITKVVASVSLIGAASQAGGLPSLAENGGVLELKDRALSVAPSSGCFTNAGILSLHDGGSLHVSGDFVQSTAGRLIVQLGSPSSAPRLACDVAMLDGEIALSLVDPSAATWGDEWTVGAYASTTGSFPVVELGTLPNPSLRLWFDQRPSSLKAGVRLIADVNRDSQVDFLDLNVVLSDFGEVGAGLQGDADGDGAVDFVDLNYVLGFFGQFAASAS